MRLTVFIGAGAAIEIGGPSSTAITKAVRSKAQDFRKEPVYFIDKVARILDDYYENGEIGFEEIYHTLESLNSFKTGWGGANKNHTPYMTAFTNPKSVEVAELFNNNMGLLVAKHDLIRVVAKMIHNYDTPENQVDQSWYSNFWNQLNDIFRLDVATLNYDTRIEQVLNNIEDGFEKTGYNFERFSPKKLFYSNESKIYHLHGCIKYGYGRPDDPNQYSLEDDFEDLNKFKTYQDAKMTWFGRSTYVSQYSEEAIIGPLITGLKKTDKAICYPYSSYTNALHNAILNNQALLIIGYSFGDIHFNKTLERIVRIQGDTRRIVIITHHPEKIWHRRWEAMHWPENPEMMISIMKMFKDHYPFDQTSPLSNPPEKIYSKDGCARLYLKGFKYTVENYLDEILQFLHYGKN